MQVNGRGGSPCDRLWTAVKDGNVDAVADVLTDSSQAVRLLQLRRRFKVSYNPKILTGPVLTLAMMNYDHYGSDGNKTIVEMLLDKKANVNATYDLFPAGCQSAQVSCPLCFIAMKETSLDIFRNAGADLNRKSALNYHVHNDLLREAAWAKNEKIAARLLGWMAQDSTLSRLATSASRGWHSDHPPLSKESCVHRSSALGRAIEVRMTCVEGLIFHAQEWSRDALEFDITQSLPTMHPRIFTQLLDCKFNIWKSLSFLLWIPEATAKKMHRTLLEQMWKTLQRHDYVMANEELCKEWLDEIGSLTREQHVRAKKLIALLIHHAPKSATIILDHFFLQEPKVERPNRNPVAMQAVIHKHTKMNTVSAHDSKWTFNVKEGCQPSWQHALITPCSTFSARAAICSQQFHCRLSRVTGWLVAHDMFTVLRAFQLCSQCSALCFGLFRGSSTVSDISVSRFCKIRVVLFKGILETRIFRAMAQMPSQEQVDLLHECATLRAVVCYTYEKFAWFSNLLFLENVVQLLTLLLVCVRDAHSDELAVYWLLFSVPAIAQVIFDALMFLLYCMSVLLSVSGELRLTRSHLRRAFFDVLHHTTGTYLISRGWGEEEGTLPETWTWFLVLTLVLKLFRILDHVSRESKLGDLFIPMTDVCIDSKMISMLILLIICWVVSVGVLQAVQGLFGQEDLQRTLLKAWVNLIVGEPVMLDVEGFHPPWYHSALISVFHFVFSVVFLNMLLATTIDTYTKKSKSLRGRIMQSKKRVCMHWLSQREWMIEAYQHLFDSTPIRAKFWAFVTVVVVVSILLVVEGLSVRMSILIISTTVLLGCRLHFMLQSATVPGSGERSYPATSIRKCFTEPPFLWVCTPEKFDKSKDEEGKPPKQLPTHSSGSGSQASADDSAVCGGTPEGRAEAERRELELRAKESQMDAMQKDLKSLMEDNKILKELLLRRLSPESPDLT
jgi:hypothetical protein